MSNTLPEMSSHEASWHEHLAGMRATEAARKLGADPAMIDAFAAATAGPVTIAGYELYPASEGTIWALKRVAREFKAWADGLGMPSAAEGAENGSRELIELGLSTLVFCDARGTFMALECGDLEGLIVRAEALMFETPVAVMKQLEAHFQTQMQRIRDLTPDAEDAPGKPPAAAASGI